MTLISIGITAYNEEKNIKNLLNSIINQKQEGFLIREIIVISDASTDKTTDMVSQINDTRIKLFIGHKRKGPNVRLNQIVSLMSKKSNCLLIFEADTLPKNKFYIKNLIGSIPLNNQYSVITGNFESIYSSNFFSQIIRTGYEFKKEIYEKAMSFPNLYLFNIDLLSNKFLKTFRWSEYFHNDSYCYRRALQSKLPIIRNKNAKLIFKRVDNIRDYFLQSGKFKKAMQAESVYSDIYTTHFNYITLLSIAIKYFCKKPFLFACYLAILIFGRLYSYRLPRYTPFWKIYESSKILRKQA